MYSKTIRRIVLRFAAALCALLFPMPSLTAVGAERVMIATPSRGLFEFPVVVAMRKGFYKDEGIDVDKVQMQPALGVKALMSGDVDYLLAWGSALRAAVTGVPIKAVVGFAGRPRHALIARPEIKTPKDLTACHCSLCRKMSGSAFSSGATIPARSFQYVAGHELLKRWESSPGYFREFCGRCGSPILKRKAKDPDNLRLRVGTLDSDPGVTMSKHTHVESKAPWIEIPDGLAQSG